MKMKKPERISGLFVLWHCLNFLFKFFRNCVKPERVKPHFPVIKLARKFSRKRETPSR